MISLFPYGVDRPVEEGIGVGGAPGGGQPSSKRKVEPRAQQLVGRVVELAQRGLEGLEPPTAPKNLRVRL